MHKLFLLPLAAAVLALPACSQSTDPSPAPVEPVPTPYMPSPQAELPPGEKEPALPFKQYKSPPPAPSGSTVLLETNKGPLKLELFKDKAPKTVASFTGLTADGFYNNTLCHRVTTEGIFVLQCGDPTGTGSGGPGYKIPDENLPKFKANNYPAGTLAMANSGPNTNGSQFFIVYRDTTLGPDYTIFGKATEGLPTVEQVAKEGVDPQEPGYPGDGMPVNPIFIKKAEVL